MTAKENYQEAFRVYEESMKKTNRLYEEVLRTHAEWIAEDDE